MSVTACPLSKSPVFSPRLPVDFDIFEELLKPPVDDGKLLVDLVDLKNAPKVPRLDVAFWWPFAVPGNHWELGPTNGTAALHAG
jgi:hypothetical protein